jgi:hypothetical protein
MLLALLWRSDRNRLTRLCFYYGASMCRGGGAEADGIRRIPLAARVQTARVQTARVQTARVQYEEDHVHGPGSRR